MLTCIAAGLALALTPALVWRLKTGVWACLQQPETFYYLQIAAQAWYNHLWYISDPIVADGVTFYPWLQYVPVVVLVRTLGLSIFSVALFWSLFAGVGIGASLYLVFWRFLRRPWIPAGLTIVCMSEFGFCGIHLSSFVSCGLHDMAGQLKRLVSALVIHPVGLWTNPFIQWRTPNPALDLPFLFIQIIAVANARERPRRLNLWMSGLAFGLLFYVYFYLWTMVAAGLFIALVFDRAGRKVYRWTLLLGFAIGLPDLVLSMRSREMVSAEAVTRFGMFVPVSRTAYPDFPLLCTMLAIAIVILVGLWIRKTRRFELIYLLSLLIAGILLTYSRLITGLFFHEYHFDWLSWPIWLVLVLITIATVAEPWIPRRPKYGLAFAALVIFYFISAIYLNVIDNPHPLR